MAQRYTSKYDDSYNRYINGTYNNTSSAVVLDPIEPGDTRRVSRDGWGYGYPSEKPRRTGTPGKTPVSTPVRKPSKQKRGHEIPIGTDIAQRNTAGLIRTGALVMILLLAILLVLSYARTDSRRLMLSGMQEELKQIKHNNTVLENEIQNNYDLEEIEAYARNTLGMTEPVESQFVYVDDVSVSYGERYDAPEDYNNTDESFNILETLAGWAGLD